MRSMSGTNRYTNEKNVKLEMNRILQNTKHYRNVTKAQKLVTSKLHTCIKADRVNHNYQFSFVNLFHL